MQQVVQIEIILEYFMFIQEVWVCSLAKMKFTMQEDLKLREDVKQTKNQYTLGHILNLKTSLDFNYVKSSVWIY